MGDPHTEYPVIHIAGTNGKTTVSRMVQQILGSHGLATGSFTSPHLDTVEERFNLHGVQVDSRDFTDAVADIAWFVVGYETENDTTVIPLVKVCIRGIRDSVDEPAHRFRRYDYAGCRQAHRIDAQSNHSCDLAGADTGCDDR